MHNDPNIFKGYYEILDEALELFPLETLTTLEFVRRQNTHSAVIYIRNDSEETRVDIDNFLGKYGFSVPRRLYEPGPKGTRTGLIAIDLGTLTTDNLRLYVTTTHNKPNDLNEEYLWGVGYYLDNQGNVLGKKHYNTNLSERIMRVDYFDSEDILVSSGTDTESVTEDWTVWGGPKPLYDAVKENNFPHQFSSKTKKDQGYFIVSIRA